MNLLLRVMVLFFFGVKLLFAQEVNKSSEPVLGTSDRVEGQWDHGFIWKSNNQENELRLFGILQTEGRMSLRNDVVSEYDQLLVRRARLYVEGMSYRFMDYRLMTDFGQERVQLLDAYMNLRVRGNDLQFRAGKFKQPFSFEQFSMEDRTIVEFERSMTDVLTPARNVGFMLYGRSVGGTGLDYFISVSRGLRDNDFDQPQSQNDIMGRIAYRFLPKFQVGFSAAIGNETNVLIPPTLRTPLQLPWQQFQSNVVSSGTRFRMSPEILYLKGPFGFVAQYIYQSSKYGIVNPTVFPSEITSYHTGFYILGTYVLTGETRPSYSDFIDPSHPFNMDRPLESSGAFELVLRVSQLGIDDSTYNSPSGFIGRNNYSQEAIEGTIGINWYLRRSIWVQAVYEHSKFSSPVNYEGASLRSHNAIAFRFTALW